MSFNDGQAFPATSITASQTRSAKRQPTWLLLILLVTLVVGPVLLYNELRPWRHPILPAAQEAALRPRLVDGNGNAHDICEQPGADCSGKEYIYYYDDGTNAIADSTSSHSEYQVGGKPVRTEDRSTLVVVRVNRSGETISALEYKTGIDQKLNPDGESAGPRVVSVLENGVALKLSDELIKNMTEAAQ